MPPSVSAPSPGHAGKEALQERTTGADASMAGQSGTTSSEATSAATESNGIAEREGIRVACKCRNVGLSVRVRVRDEEGAELRDQKVGSDAESKGGKGLRAMQLVSGEVIRHKALATFEPAGSALQPEAEGEAETERPSRSAATASVNANTGGNGSTNGVGPEDEVVRRCWLCETDVYIAKGKARDAVLGEGDAVEVDTGSKVYNPTAPVDTQTAGESATPSFSSLTLDLPGGTSSFGRPPSSSVSSSSLYPSLSPATSARNQATSTHAGHSSTSIPHVHAHSSRSTSLLPRLPDPFFLPPPFTPSHPYLHDLSSSAVLYLHEAQDAAERDVRLYIEQKAREMSRLQEQTRKEVEAIWDAYVRGPGRGEEMERRRSRSVSLSRRASRGRKVSGLGPSTASTASTAGNAAGMGTGSATLGGSALDTEDGVGASSVSPTALGSSSTPQAQPQPQPTDNPIMRAAGPQAPYTGGSLLSASISRNSQTYMAAASPSASAAASAQRRSPSATEKVTEKAADNDIDELSQNVALQGDQRAVAMSYVFSGMDEMEKQRERERERRERSGRDRDHDRRASASRDRKERENEEVNEAVDKVQQSLQKDVHGKDSWIDEERNLAARYKASGTGAGAAGVSRSNSRSDRKEDGRNGEGRGSRGDVGEEEQEGKTPRANSHSNSNTNSTTGPAGQRPRVTFQENKPVREPKQGLASADVGKGDDPDGEAVAAATDGDKDGEDEDNVFDFELEAPSQPPASSSPDTTDRRDSVSGHATGATSASAQAPVRPRPKVQDMYESLLSTTLASDIPSHRAAHARMKATGHNPYEFLRRRVSTNGDDESLDGSEGSGSGIGTPRGTRDAPSALARSMPVNIVMPASRHRSAGGGGGGFTGLPPLEPKTSLSERQGLLVPGLKGAMRIGSGSGSGSGSGQSGSGAARGRTGPGEVGADSPEATPRPRTHIQGFTVGPSIAHTTGAAAGAATAGAGSVSAGAGRTRRGSRSASVSRERETFKHDPGAVLELVGEADDADGDGDGDGGIRTASPLSAGDGVGRDTKGGAGAGVGAGAEAEGEMSADRTSDLPQHQHQHPHPHASHGQKKGFMPPHILARQESLRSDDVGWRSMISD